MSNTYNTITISNPAVDGSQTLTVDTAHGGKLVVGTVALPALPTGDGNYRLHIASGVATWVTDAS